MKDVEYTRIDVGKGREKRHGKVVVDGVVEIKVNDSKPFRMDIVPKNMEDAALGRLVFMGLIGSMEDVLEMKSKDSF